VFDRTWYGFWYRPHGRLPRERIDPPIGSSNERALADALREVRSIIAATGASPQDNVVRNYDVGEPSLTIVRINYSKIRRHAGPYGLWPQNTGPSAYHDCFKNKQFLECRLRDPAQHLSHGRESGRSCAAGR